MGPLRTLLLAAVCLFSAFAQPAARRPMTIADYDSWKTIANQELSRDGKFLAYAVLPGVGDGEVVLRQLAGGRETRIPVGALPPRPEGGGEGEESSAAPRGPRITFTADGRYLLIGTFPTKAAADEAKRKKAKPEEAPKPGLAIVATADGAVVRIDAVEAFAVPEEASNVVVYRRPAKAKDPFELVVRELASAAERKIAGVTEYTLAPDGALIAYATADAVLTLAPGGEPKAIQSGKAKYAKLTWDEPGRLLAFAAGRSLYGWKRGDAAAAVWVTAPEGQQISDRAALTFSPSADRLFFSVAPAPVEGKPADPAAERAVFELWHYRDERLQTIQKVRATQDRNRSFRQVVHLADRRVVPLGDEQLSEILTSDDGLAVLGIDDHPYRATNDWDDRYKDIWLVDPSTGQRSVLAERVQGSPVLSPDGKFAVYFTRGNWWVINIATNTRTNLTAHLTAVKNGPKRILFREELHDSPGLPNNYGPALWTADSKAILVHDRYDVWALAPDASEARNLTESIGRQRKIQFRVQRPTSNPKEKYLDPAAPLLLRAESEETRESGFWRDQLTGDAPPVELTMQPRKFSAPRRARSADVLVLTATTFSESPDLLITDSTFARLDKVSHANPQQAQYAWGTAERMSFTNTNGVPLGAILFKPAGFDPAKKYPLLVYIYERLSQNLHEFWQPAPSHRLNPTLYASNGYVVVMPDIAYTIGYPGQSAMNAVLPAVQKVVDQGYIDEKRIGIQGHSWGGYQIAYMVTRTNRFRAAAPGALVANMFSAYDGIRYGTGLPRQFQYERTQSRIGGSIWEYPLRFLENSPLFMADRVETPILMLHNDADDAVPWTQGIEFFLALRRLGKEAYFFNYNGEPHGLMKRANQKDYAMRMFQFFGYFLKDEPKPAWMENGIPYLDRDKPASQAIAPSDDEADEEDRERPDPVK